MDVLVQCEEREREREEEWMAEAFIEATSHEEMELTVSVDGR